MKVKTLIATAVFLLTSAAANAGTIVYGTGSDNPWSNLTNDAAMNSAFGESNWLKSYGFSTSLFNDAEFVFLDGSDGNADAFSSFLAGNLSFVQNYVANGGHLFLNAAPNVGSSFDMGFGVRLNYGNYAADTVYVTGAGVAAGLTADGLATTYHGNSFSHASVSGAISDLINDGKGNTVFGAMQYGKGFVAFGGQTTTNFHSPSPDGAALLVNQLQFVAGPQSNDVPEPASLALIGMGLLAAAAARRKSAGK